MFSSRRAVQWRARRRAGWSIPLSTAALAVVAVGASTNSPLRGSSDPCSPPHPAPAPCTGLNELAAPREQRRDVLLVAVAVADGASTNSPLRGSSDEPHEIQARMGFAREPQRTRRAEGAATWCATRSGTPRSPAGLNELAAPREQRPDVNKLVKSIVREPQRTRRSEGAATTTSLPAARPKWPQASTNSPLRGSSDSPHHRPHGRLCRLASTNSPLRGNSDPDGRGPHEAWHWEPQRTRRFEGAAIEPRSSNPRTRSRCLNELAAPREQRSGPAGCGPSASTSCLNELAASREQRLNVDLPSVELRRLASTSSPL